MPLATALERDQIGKHFTFIYFLYKTLNNKKLKILNTSNTTEYYSVILLFYKQSHVAILFTDFFFFNSTLNKEGNPSLRSLVINHSSVELMF